MMTLTLCFSILTIDVMTTRGAPRKHDTSVIIIIKTNELNLHFFGKYCLRVLVFDLYKMPGEQRIKYLLFYYYIYFQNHIHHITFEGDQ